MMKHAIFVVLTLAFSSACDENDARFNNSHELIVETRVDTGPETLNELNSYLGEPIDSILGITKTTYTDGPEYTFTNQDGKTWLLKTEDGRFVGSEPVLKASASEWMQSDEAFIKADEIIEEALTPNAPSP